MACPSHATASVMSQFLDNVYLYQFTHLWDELFFLKDTVGVFHGAELIGSFAMHDGLFQLPDDKYIPIVLSIKEKEMSDHMVDYWTSFATHGDPNVGSHGALHWPSFNGTTNLNLKIDLDLSVDANLKQSQCALWSKLDLLKNPK